MKAEPKVIINLIDKNGKKRRMTNKASMIKKKSQASLMSEIKMNDFKLLNIEVIYAKDTINSMRCNSYEDLKWGIDAFLEKELWI